MHNHFEALEDYDSEIPEHIRSHLLEKKLSLQLQYIQKKYAHSNLRVLDIGCGTGWHVKWMSELGFEVHGIDSSSRQCERARTNAPNATISNGSVLALPFDDGYFDIIYTINTLHHLSGIGEQQNAMIEIEPSSMPFNLGKM